MLRSDAVRCCYEHATSLEPNLSCYILKSTHCGYWSGLGLSVWISTGSRCSWSAALSGSAPVDCLSIIIVMHTSTVCVCTVCAP